MLEDKFKSVIKFKSLKSRQLEFGIKTNGISLATIYSHFLLHFVLLRFVD